MGLDCTITGPKLISGTNVKFGISIVGKAYRHPKDVEVTLECLTDQTSADPTTTLYSIQDNGTAFINLLVTMDSTHFRPADVLRISVHAVDDWGRSLDTNFTTTVYNRFEKLYNEEFKSDRTVFTSVTNFDRYTDHFRLPVWAEPEVLQSMRDASIIHISSHGDEAPDFQISNPSGSYGNDPETNYIYPATATVARQSSKSLKLPPIVLAWFAMCSTGHNASQTGSEFYKTLILTDSANIEDRAMVQFKVRIYNDNSWPNPSGRTLARFHNGAFDDLAQMRTLNEALSNNIRFLITNVTFNHEGDYSNPPTLSDLVRFEGDPAMTLRGLYAANAQERVSGIWFKVIRR